MMKIQAYIEVPLTPNFLSYVVKGHPEKIMVAIQDLTDEELQNIGNQFTKQLIEKARKKRKK